MKTIVISNNEQYARFGAQQTHHTSNEDETTEEPAAHSTTSDELHNIRDSRFKKSTPTQKLLNYYTSIHMTSLQFHY